MLFVLLGCFLRCLPLFFVSAWWNRGIADEVTIASFCKAVTGTAVMARSANEEKKNFLKEVLMELEITFIEECKEGRSLQKVGGCMATPPRHSRTEANCPRVRAIRPAAAVKEVPAPNPSMRIPGVAKRERRSRFFFLLYAAWVRSRAERPSVSHTKVVMGVAWTGHNLQFKKTN